MGALAGGLGTKVFQQGPGAEPRWGMMAKPQTAKARRMLRHEAEKTTYRERKTRPYRLTLYDNVIIIIISSTHRFMFLSMLS